MAKDNRVNLSCTVPKQIREKMGLIADWEEQTISRLAAKAIKLYVFEQEKKGHPALKKDDSSDNPSEGKDK